MKASRRSRYLHEQRLRALIEQCTEQAAQLDALEKRIDALVSILEEAGISLPSKFNDTLLYNLTASDDQGGSAFSSDNVDQLFEDVLDIIDDDDS